MILWCMWIDGVIFMYLDHEDEKEVTDDGD